MLLAIERADSAVLGGTLVAALLVPHVVAAPVVGALADRVRHRRLFYATTLAAYGVALLVLGLGTGTLPPPVLLALAALGGRAGPMITGGLTGLLRELVPDTARTRAYSLDSMTYNLSQIGARSADPPSPECSAASPAPRPPPSPSARAAWPPASSR
ncbi:MFS transporter [Streptoalloteichus hindustanus]|uniref:Major Facilitator Superfamily protein n=1 Tax=Streptoalloteichus hindustanus TaxID=2017 RepID=A0A1M5D3V6_STRHI|nr:MFS transporter [Streptoalloteichus hindustanus]SHF61547.1 Major Facilitator Superfamily protein [Streptoalloteichus hindustanus]